jgi:uncharacterized protein YbjT (DUF2867 family)
MTVLVIGATGKTGRPLVETLAGRGVEVRAASRHPAPGPGTAVHFDWARRATWQPALAGVDALYVVGPYAEPDAPVLVRDLLAAATDVRRVVLLSILGVDALPDVIPMAVWEQQVREFGLEWTILRPNWFMQNFGSLFAESLRDHGLLALPASDAAVSFVDTRDIAMVAAASLTEDGHAGNVYPLTGPEALTHDEVVALLAAAATRDLRYDPLAPDGFTDNLRTAGASSTVITWQSALFGLIRDGVNSPVTGTVERITGRPARTLKAYAEQSADTWR